MGCVPTSDTTNRIVNAAIHKKTKEYIDEQKKKLESERLENLQKKNYRKIVKSSHKKKKTVIDLSINQETGGLTAQIGKRE